VAETAKNNLISSPETYARNLEFATLRDTALIKGYLFNYLDLGQDNQYTYLLSVWRSHLDIPLINLLGFFTFILVLTGLYYSFRKNFTWTKSFVGVLALCLFFLLGGGLLINNQIPLIGELFRAPFTKFSIPLSLAYAFFFSIGTIFLLDLFTYLHSRLTFYLTLFTVTLSLLLFMSPAFSGNLISPSMRRPIPNEYFQLFSYMRTQDPSTRIANFPQFSFWGWQSYDWGYRGSGFLWYGLRQPLLDRAFDVWDKNNERYYEEMSTALYSSNRQEFESVLDKYAVNWLLLDENITLPGNASDSGLITLKKFIAASAKFKLTEKFSDRLSLYQVTLTNPHQSFLRIDNSTPPSFPFTSLSLRPNTGWTQKGEYLNISVPTASTVGDTLTIPSLTESEALLPVRVEYRKNAGDLNLRFTPIIPTIFLNLTQLDLPSRSVTLSIPDTVGTGFILELDHNYFELQLPAEIESFSDYYPLNSLYLPTQKEFSVALYSSSPDTVIDITNRLSEADPFQCYLIKPNRKVEKIVTPNGVSLLGTDVVGCLSANLPFIPKDTLISLAYTYSSPTLTTANVNLSGKNLEAQNLPQPLEPKTKPTRARLFVPSSGKAQQVNLILEAAESKSIREIDYENIEVSTLPPVYSDFVTLPIIPAKTFVLQGDLTRIQISLAKTDTQYDLVETPASNSLLPESLNCDQFNSGLTVKKVTDSGFLYQSQNAIECDTLSLRQMPHTLSYLLSFSLEHQKGLTPTICLENHSSRRCDVQERLIDSKELQSIIQPVTNPQENIGYTLHLYNQSLGTRITSNLIQSISVRPIPFNFLQKISLTKAPSGSSPTSQIKSLSHPNSFLYLLSTETNQDSTLHLSQTQSPFWKAFKITANDLDLPSWLLILSLPLTGPVLPQLTPNSTGWSNSWSLPAGDSTLALVYFPQYLEFLGLVFLLLTPVVLLLIFLLNKKHHHPKK